MAGSEVCSRGRMLWLCSRRVARLTKSSLRSQESARDGTEDGSKEMTAGGNLRFEIQTLHVGTKPSENS